MTCGRVCFALLIVLVVSCVFLTAASAAPFQIPQAQPSGPKIWLGPSQPVAMSQTGALVPAPGAIQGAAPQPVSLASGDVDGDGITDLIAGYSTGAGGFVTIQRGNLDAFAPQSEAALLAIGQGHFPSPFLAEAQTFAVPVSPDFLVSGDFSGSGHLDVAVAARGGNTVYILAGDGKGNFAAPQAFTLPGAVTTMAAGILGRTQLPSLLIGLSDPQTGFSLHVYNQTPEGLSEAASFSLADAASNILFGDFGDVGNDAAFLSGGDVVILHASSLQLEQLSLPVSASAMALGSFIYDRKPHIQIALLSSDGSIHIAAHSEFDPHTLSVDEMRANRQAIRNGEANPLVPQRSVALNGWKIVETIPGAAPFGSDQPIFFRTRISDHGADDLTVLSSSAGQMVVISHPDVPPDTPTFSAAQISTLPYTGSPVAALPLRTNIDGRPGVVALHAGQSAPMVMMPLPDPTFFVNRFDDPTPTSPISNACTNNNFNQKVPSCSLREAVLKANATAGTDTINLTTGTYQLSIAKVPGDYSGNFGALYINDSVNIAGAGQSATIVQAGTTASNGVDLVMAVNEDISPLTNATASISSLTLKFGLNKGTHGNDGDGGCMEFDTGTSGTANLTLTNVTLDTCSTTQGNGAGIAIFNFLNPGTGLATFSGVIIQNSSAVDSTTGVGAGGGGIWVSQASRMSMTNSQVLNNKATQVNGTGLGIGGGIFIFNNTFNSPQTVIHGSTISGNKSAGFGGGIWSISNLLIDQSSVISGNTAGTNGTSPIANQFGGGLYLNTSPNGCPSACTDSTTLTQVSITGNTATGNGGGIALGNNSGAGNLTMHFSRLAGNTATAGSNNLDNNSSTALVTNNWWGTVTPANTIHNSTNAVAANTTFDPYINLTHTASPSPIRINQSTTLTADISKDNHGTTVTNLTQVIGLPITFNNPVLGTIPNAQPETIGATGTATATFNAGGTSGLGKADATVDQATVTATFPILEPLRIVKSFGAAFIPVNGVTTVNFAITNPNVVAVDGNFTDTFPAGLVVAATPGVTNTCGGTVTATAGSGSVSFSNASLPVGSCTVSVNVTGTVDNVLSNSVTINSTAAGSGTQSTSTANLTVINPPTIAKAFSPTSIPLNSTSTLTFTLTSTNVNLTLNGVAFTDSLPAGLVVASTPNLTSTCSGTATATAGSSSISLSAASLAPGASCTVSAAVQGTTAGVLSNSVQATSTNGGTGNTSNASITVVAPPAISKLFGARSIPLNGSTSLAFTIQNNNTTTTLTGVGFTDTLPAGLVIATPNGLTGSCGGGTITATAGTGVVTLSGASLAASSSCTFSINVTGTAAGAQNNTTSNVTSTEGGTGNAASDTLKVEAPPSIAKAFNPATIALNGTSSLTFTITNPAANVDALTGVAFTDTLPTGLTVANASATVCGGTLTTTAPTGIALSGASIAVSSQCVFSVTVTGAASGQYTNTTGAVTSTNGGTGNTASANLTVASPPTIAKAFSPVTIPLNGTSTLTLTIQNPNTGVTLNGIAFTDSLPAGLLVASTPNLNNTCGGTATAVGGSSSVSLTAGTLAASASCTVSVTIQGVTAGAVSNSVQVTSTEGGTGNTSSATLTVVAPPAISKLFAVRSIPLNGSTSLSFTIQNSNTATTLTGIGFTDTLPAGLVVASTPSLTNTCGGTATATAGTNAISLSGGSVAASSSCTVSVNVTGTAAGAQNNTTSNVTSTEGGAGNVGSDTLNVEAPPSIAKAFLPPTVPLGSATTLTFTITNPAANVDALTGVAFTDTLPAGEVIATPNGLTGSCGGGTITATQGTNVISLAGASIPVNSSCTFSVNITGTAAGLQTNTTGAVTSTNGGTGNTASANLTVVLPPSINKSFGVTSLALDGSKTTLTFDITNPNTGVSLSGISFTDNFPTGLAIPGSGNNLVNTCGGNVSANPLATGVLVDTVTLPPNSSCSVQVTIQGTAAGVLTNSVQVNSSNGGLGNTSTATITIVAPPAISKLFGARSIPLNGSTSLAFTIQNNNTTTTLTGIGFTDTLPAGLVIATPNGLTGSCGGGTITATAGTGVVTLSGASLAASSSCTFSINVTGTAAGAQNNTTSNVTSTEGGTGNAASDTLKVEAPPSIAKAFNPATIALNGTSSLTFTITNPAANVDALTGVAFTDTLPTGLTVANASATVCGGTLTTTAPTGIALSGASIAASSQCVFSVTVTGAASGQYTNTTGAVTSTNGGTGNTASANLTVASPPTIAKAFSPVTIPLNGTSTLTLTIQNPNTGVTLNGIAFTDSLPAGLLVASTPNLNNTCGGTATAVGSSSSVSLTAGTLAASASCTVSVTIQGVTAGAVSNSVQVTSTEGGTGNTSSATLTVVAPPAISKLFAVRSIPLNGSTSLSFTIQNSNTTTTLTGIGFTDTLPAGLLIATPNGLTGSCGGGTITATAGTNVISLSGASLAASSSCTFSINVTGTAAGAQNNTTSNVTSTEGGTGNAGSDTLKVEAPPSIAKAFSPAAIALNATTSLTFTITNPAANVDALAGVAFTDTLPTGLTVANASATVCGGTLTTTAPTGIALSGTSITANSQCVFSVTVTGVASGQYTNTTGAVTSTNGGTGNTASANLTVATPPTIVKSFGALSILVNANTSLSFNITNPNTTLGLTGISFADTLPAGLLVATPNGLTGSCGGGTITATQGTNAISLSGASLAASGSCSFTLNVTGLAAGVQNNTTGPISSNESGAGATSNTATITVIGPPSIAKAFGAASINLNATTTLSFTITNPNATVPLNGVAFGDTLPVGLVVANPNGLTGSCGAGTITTGTVSGSSVVNLSGGDIAAGGSCTFSVNVVGTTGGHKVNTTGTVSSTNAGTGNTATASIDVLAPDPTITKTHVGKFTRGQTGAQYTITVTNAGFGPTVGTITVIDTLPNVQNTLVPTDISGTGWTCTLATLTCVRTDPLATGGSYPAITLTVNIPINIQNTFTNTVTVSGGGDVNPNNNTASDTVSLGPPIILTPQSTSLTVSAGQTAIMPVIVDAPDPTLGKITFTCSGLPAASACSFSPSSIDTAVTPGPTTLTVSIFTTKGTASLVTPQIPGRTGRTPVYAMLSLPVFGVMLAGFGARRRRGVKEWAGLLMLGLVLLLAMAGCGVAPPPPPPVAGTPAGTYVVTVTATSATFTATTSFNLVVQ